MGLEARGRGVRRRRRKKFPICVKAYVIDPSGAASQKLKDLDCSSFHGVLTVKLCQSRDLGIS